MIISFKSLHVQPRFISFSKVYHKRPQFSIVILSSGFYGKNLAACDCRLAYLGSETMAVRHLEFSVYRLKIYRTQLPVIVVEIVDMVLVNYKIRYYRLEVKGRCGAQRACAHMGLHPYIIDIGHIAYLFDFGDAAAVSDIWLYHRDRRPL